MHKTLIVIGMVLACGCGGGAADVNDAGGVADAGIADAGGGAGGGDAGAVDAACVPSDGGSPTALSGTFITRSVIAVKIEQGGLSPNPQVTHASQYFVTTYAQDGTHLKFASKPCYLDLPDTHVLGDMRVTETFGGRRPVSEFLPTIVNEGEFLSSPDPCAAYTPADQTVYLGYDGSGDPALPTDPAGDPRVFDQDGDGKPGLSIHIEGLPIIGTVDGYVVEKTVTKESGVYVNPSRIEGRVDFYRAEENVFDATNPAAKGNNPKISYADDPPHKDPFGEIMPPGLNTFVSKRVDGAHGSPALLTTEPTSDAEFDAACKQLFGQECDPQNPNRCWATCRETATSAMVKCTQSDLFE